MLNRIISWSLEHRFLVLVLAAIVAAAGIVALSRLPVDAFPDTTPVQVQINTAVPALSAEEVE
ncbi:MAG TPA: efflux RND transporter permease subunit, partial [Planctomycetota bacterium]|nr:efflux RND transporter permease subunit [Planctomycetota bacterium]